jgi:hypothetical protein
MTNLLTPENYLDYVKDWQDPNPAPIVEKHGKFFVVRDDLLGVGSKVRFIDHLIKTDPAEEWVFGGANKVGWGPISLTHVCNQYGKKATFFMAKRETPTWHQQQVLDMGGTIHWVNMGMLNVTLSRAKAYCEESPTTRKTLPLGLEHPSVLGSIIKIARALPCVDEISEIWTVASSGTLNRGLQLAFPNLSAHAVQIGHKMSERELGRAKLYVSKYKFDKEVKQEEKPPYPSEMFYDAKIWTFVNEHANENALIWNVA